MSYVTEQAKVIVYKDDLSEKAYEYFVQQEVLGCDTETTGFDPEKNDLQLIQIASKDNRVALVQFYRNKSNPVFIQKLMAAPQVTKIFHYAPFDLRFLTKQADVTPNNIFCTKEASVKVRGSGPAGYHKLNTIAKAILNVDLDKSFMGPGGNGKLPDWSGELTEQHLEYATNDVLVLIPLYEFFLKKMSQKDVSLVKQAATNLVAKYR